MIIYINYVFRFKDGKARKLSARLIEAYRKQNKQQYSYGAMT